MSGTVFPMYMDADIIGVKRSMLPIQNEFSKNEKSVQRATDLEYLLQKACFSVNLTLI